eukprot:TRINITY_DN4111_c0_g1::TRINITY_DN4111_c0_g1_i1::g.2154::m.2154 TRINITY_DN4111_c0_g1::TRINITY_DN4111_c0_g1_i1::g.2154  ORF type:complete len:1005 (-),score=260.76,sp/P25286/VPP1_RAT/34.06/4e-122,sp/P25286/VPP1_RAT/58.91/2e-33,V_ATPase_I/PF01496.14/9.7e-193,stn_TNFRSF12A/PF12191.3/0.19 TRINITY_DN4111_c0_g1_i1:184-3198(-)
MYFRSEDMCYIQLFLQKETALDALEEIARLEVIQFTDLRSEETSFQRPFFRQVRQCEEIENTLQYLETQVINLDLNSALGKKINSFSQKDYGVELQRSLLAHDHLGSAHHTIHNTISSRDEINAHASEVRQQYEELLRYFEHASKRRTELMEWCGVLNAVTSVFDTRQVQQSLEEVAAGQEVQDIENIASNDVVSQLNILAGAVSEDRVAALERVMFRALRGNMLFRTAPISNPDDVTTVEAESGRAPRKDVVFMVFFRGEHARAPVTKISAAFAARLYNVPPTQMARSSLLAQVSKEAGDIDQTMRVNTDQRKGVLGNVAPALRLWLAAVARDKAIYHCLNMFDTTTSNQYYIGEGWCLSRRVSDVQAALTAMSTKTDATLSFLQMKATKASPPTSFKSNEVLQAFQDIVDSYGVARYKELNPAPFTAITFPFLFAVMFGDAGHGLMLAVMGAYLVWRHSRRPPVDPDTDSEFTVFLDGARYLILLMGVFSIYTGLLYNEFFAIPLDLFGTKWEFYGNHTVASGKECQIYSHQTNTTESYSGEICNGYFPTEVYPFGVDPVWIEATNGLIFMNSMKMKMSIIIGVMQMTLGIILSGFNAKFFSRPLDFLCEVVPQLIFLLSIFGYMCIIAFVKWSTLWYEPEDYHPLHAQCDAPDLKEVMIEMFMAPGSKDFANLFDGQSTLQVALVLIAFFTVPIMLLAKPLILLRRHNRSLIHATAHHGRGHGHSHGHDDFSPVPVTDMDPDLHAINMSSFVGEHAAPSLTSSVSASSSVSVSVSVPSASATPAPTPTHSARETLAPDVSLLPQGTVDSSGRTTPTPKTSVSLVRTLSNKFLPGGGSGSAPAALSSSPSSSAAPKEGASAPPPSSGHDHDDEEFVFGDVMVHQMIHTIEFVLGAISNTASYLRLWALSLAHSQLSKVFLEKLLVMTLESGVGFMAFVGMGAWLGCTLGVLMIMESLSSALHALRLHWVEFQNKFYGATGHKFMPFCLKIRVGTDGPGDEEQ